MKIKRIKQICQQCRKVFYAKPWYVKIGGGKYCSHKCYSTYCKVHKTLAGGKNPMWKGGGVKRICEHCGKEFSISHSFAKIGRGKYCSHSCSNKNRKKKGQIKICKWCGEKFYIKPYENKVDRRKFCSYKCKAKYQKTLTGEKSCHWLGGKSFEPYPPAFNQQLKDRIRVRDSFICQLCGVPELECNERLSVHHIDYVKENCQDDNLNSLCRKCNFKVNYNRPHWTNYFQNKLKENNETTIKFTTTAF